jgi:hypothetical protein
MKDILVGPSRRNSAHVVSGCLPGQVVNSLVVQKYYEAVCYKESLKRKNGGTFVAVDEAMVRDKRVK